MTVVEEKFFNEMDQNKSKYDTRHVGFDGRFMDEFIEWLVNWFNGTLIQDLCQFNR